MKKVEQSGFVPASIRRRIQTMLLLRYNTLGCQVTMIGTEYKAFYGQDLDPSVYGFNSWQAMLKSMAAYVTVSKSGGGTIVKSLPFDHSVAVEYANKLHPPGTDMVPPTDQRSVPEDVYSFMDQFLDAETNQTLRDTNDTTDNQNQRNLLNPLSPINPELVDTVSSSSPDSPVMTISVGVGTESVETIEEVALRIVSIASHAGGSTSDSLLDQTAHDSAPATIVEFERASPLTEQVQVDASVVAGPSNNIVTDDIDIGPIVKLENAEYPVDLDINHGALDEEGTSQAVPQVVDRTTMPTAAASAPNVSQNNDSLESNYDIQVKDEPADPLDEAPESPPFGMSQTLSPINNRLRSGRLPIPYVKLERLELSLDIKPNLDLVDPGRHNNIADSHESEENNTSTVDPAVNSTPTIENSNEGEEMEPSAQDHDQMVSDAPNDNEHVESAQDDVQMETAAAAEEQEEPPKHKRRRKSSSTSFPGRASPRIASLKNYTSSSPSSSLEQQPPKKRKTGRDNGKNSARRVATRAVRKSFLDEDYESDDSVSQRDHLLALTLYMEDNDVQDYEMMLFEEQMRSQPPNTPVPGTSQETDDVAASIAEPVAGPSKNVMQASLQQVESPIIEAVDHGHESIFNQPLSQFVNEIIEAGPTSLDLIQAECSPVEWFYSNKEQEILSINLSHYQHQISDHQSRTIHSYLDGYASGLSGFDVKALERIRHNQNPKILFFHPFFSLSPQNQGAGFDVQTDTDCIATDIMISSLSFDSIQIANVDASLNYELSKHFLAENNNQLLVVSSYANYSDYFHWSNGLNATNLVLLDSDQDVSQGPRANNCHVFDGDGESVSIFDPATTRKFRNFVQRFREKVDVFIANAMGFQNMKHRPQDLTISQLLLACEVLRPGGIFVIKLQDAFTCLGIGLIFIMSQLYDNIALYKPESALPGERFVICRWMRSDEYFERIKEFLRSCNECRIVESLLFTGVEINRLFVKGHTIEYLRTQDPDFLQYIQKLNKAIGNKEVTEFNEMENNCKQVLVEGQIPAHVKQQILIANEKKRNQMLISWNYQQNKQLKAEVVNNNDQQINNDN